MEISLENLFVDIGAFRVNAEIELVIESVQL